MDETLLANNSQHYWMLHVTSLCIPCCRLLRVVGSCCARFETGQTFGLTTSSFFFFAPWSLKHSATMLNPFAKLYYWGQACPLHMVYKVLWVVSFPQFSAGPNNVGSCCIRLRTTANTDATTPNVLGPTTLAVVLSINCSSLKKEFLILSYPITIKTKFAIEFVT